MAKRAQVADVYNIHHLRYSFTGGHNTWDYRKLDRVIVALAVFGERRVPLHIPVCRIPVLYHYPIRRVASGLWLLAPSMYVPGPGRDLFIKREDLDPALSSTFLGLSGAPDYVEAMFDDL